MFHIKRNLAITVVVGWLKVQGDACWNRFGLVCGFVRSLHASVQCGTLDNTIIGQYFWGFCDSAGVVNRFGRG